MRTHEIIGGIAAVVLIICILLLLWTKIDWKILLKMIATTLIVLKFCTWYDEKYYEEDN